MFITISFGTSRYFDLTRSFEKIYTVNSMLGEGGFGFVIEATNKLDQQVVAVKCVHLKTYGHWH